MLRNETKDNTRSQWRPYTPKYGQGRPLVVDQVTVYRSASVRLSNDIVEQFGNPERVQLLTDGTPNRFAICAATGRPGSVAVSATGRQSEIKAWGLLKSLGKAFDRLEWSIELPHHWEGDVLVVDISEIPDRGAEVSE